MNLSKASTFHVYYASAQVKVFWGVFQYRGRLYEVHGTSGCANNAALVAVASRCWGSQDA